MIPTAENLTKKLYRRRMMMFEKKGRFFMRKKASMNPIAEAIRAYLVQDDWYFNYDEKKNAFKFMLGMKGKIKIINYSIYVKEDEYSVVVLSPIGVDEDRTDLKLKMAEYICRVNNDMKAGCFELDFDDGEITFKMHVCCKDSMPSAAVIRDSISCPAMMFEQYGAGLLDILLTHITPKDAVEKCEQDVRLALQKLLDEAMESAAQSADAAEAESCGDTASAESEIRTELFENTEEGNDE